MLTWVSLLFELKYDACQNLLNRRGDATAWAKLLGRGKESEEMPFLIVLTIMGEVLRKPCSNV